MTVAGRDGVRLQRRALRGASGLVLMASSVHPRVMMLGLAAAHVRFEEARVEKDPDGAYIPLFEALSWVVALQEHLPAMYREEPHLAGIRWARNTVHHNGAHALELDESGRAYPISFPMTFFEWRWRADIVEPRNATGRDDYRDVLAGRPVRVALSEAVHLLHRGVESLFPAP